MVCTLIDHSSRTISAREIAYSLQIYYVYTVYNNSRMLAFQS